MVEAAALAVLALAAGVVGPGLAVRCAWALGPRGDFAYGPARATVIAAVHPVVIHEHLMDTWLTLEPHDIHPGEPGL